MKAERPFPSSASRVLCRAADCERERLLLFSGNRILQRPDGASHWSRQEVDALGLAGQLCVPLADADGASTAVLALPVDFTVPDGAELVSTRSLLLDGGFEASGDLARGAQLANWLRSHRYCGVCGGATSSAGEAIGEQVLRCSQCQEVYYPRISPCVIVLVTRGRRILLARSARRNVNFYSCLAGFIEVAETPEQAVEREVMEEVGIRIANLRYFGSQPWPFPSQLMLGYHAEYAGGDLRPDRQELATADWFDVADLPPTPSARISVAGQLIDEYKKSI